MRSLVALAVLVACNGEVEGDTRDAGSRDAGGLRDAGGVDAARPGDAAIARDAGFDGGDLCSEAAFCETFDDYAAMTIGNGDTFGPWRAALRTPGGAMDLDGTHVTSGDLALRVRIDDTVEAGGRLFARGDVPVLAGRPSRLYGRMMMYIAENGSSVHWTLFGTNGPAVASSPVAGIRASYLLSSLPRSGVNTWSFVNGIAAHDSEPFHDCWFQSMEPMRTDGWVCLAFEIDSEGRHLRLYLDDGTDPAVALDDRGQGCVGEVADDSLWYGPAIDEFYVGAWSFHPMDGALDVWIDDVILDTAPVSCSAL